MGDLFVGFSCFDIKGQPICLSNTFVSRLKYTLLRGIDNTVGETIFSRSVSNEYSAFFVMVSNILGRLFQVLFGRCSNSRKGQAKPCVYVAQVEESIQHSYVSRWFHAACSAGSMNSPFHTASWIYMPKIVNVLGEELASPKIEHTDVFL